MDGIVLLIEDSCMSQVPPQQFARQCSCVWDGFHTLKVEITITKCFSRNGIKLLHRNRTRINLVIWVVASRQMVVRRMMSSRIRKVWLALIKLEDICGVSVTSDCRRMIEVTMQQYSNVKTI